MRARVLNWAVVAAASVVLCASGLWLLLALFYFGVGACSGPLNLLFLLMAIGGAGAALAAFNGAVDRAARRHVVPGFVATAAALGLYLALPAITC